MLVVIIATVKVKQAQLCSLALPTVSFPTSIGLLLSRLSSGSSLVLDVM